MHVELVPARADQQATLGNLMTLYLYDFSIYTHEDADENGLFIDHHLPFYWIEPNRYPFFILADGQYAGFVLVRDVTGPTAHEPVHHIAEFFVMRKYRRMKVGLRAAWTVFDRFPGRWHVAEMESNKPAQDFWRRIITEYTRGAFTEVRLEEWEGPVQLFTSPGNANGGNI